MAEAKNWAAPGGVRSTTRLALASRADQQLAAQPGQPLPGRGGVLRRRRASVAALAGHGVDQRAGLVPDLDRVRARPGRATAWSG